MAWGTVLEGTKVSNASTDLKATGIVISPNASTNEGELMIAYVQCLSLFDHVWQTPSGWTQIFDLTGFQGRDRHLAVYGKYAGASEGSTTFKTDKDNDSPPNIGVILTYPGGDPSTMLDVTYSEANHTTDDINTPSPNDVAFDSITTNTDNAYVVCFTSVNDEENITSWVASSGYTIISSDDTDADRSYMIQHKIITTAGAESPGTAEWEHDGFLIDTTVATIALKPSTANANLLMQNANYYL